MKKTIGEIAEMLGAAIEGDPDTVITGVSAIKTAASGDITFARSAKYAGMIANCGASAVLVDREVVVPARKCALLRVDNPMTALDRVAALFVAAPPEFKPGIHPTAVIAKSAAIDKSAHIGALSVVQENAVIGAGTVVFARAYIGHDAQIGRDCRIHPGCVVMERCVLHDRVILQPGAVIGGDGFGFSRDEQGRPVKIPQLGWVELEDDVEVGSNSTIDRARFGRTLLEKGVKLDNLVHVAHNVRLGQGCALSGQVGISGSVDVGKNVLFGGQAGVRDNLSIGDNAIITARTAVLHDVNSGEIQSGFPGLPSKQYLRLYTLYRKLPQLFDKVKKLEEKLAQSDDPTKDN